MEEGRRGREKKEIEEEKRGEGLEEGERR